MIITIDEWVFDVDITATMEYSAQEAQEHCTCAYCRNFYAAVETYYPNLRPFLALFGLDIEAPDRMSPIGYSVKEICYDPEYYVLGRILHMGKYEFSVGPANICVPDWEGEVNGHPAFSLNVFEVLLPWVLDEPLEERVR